MTSGFKLFLYAMEAFAFVALLTLFFFARDSYVRTEAGIKREVGKKNDIVQTYNDMEKEDSHKITGSAVITEVMSYDDSITVQINSTVLNTIPNEFGISFFEYLKEYGTEQLLNEVSINSKYIKSYGYDTDGNLIGVNYRVTY